MSKIRFAEITEPETPATERAYLYLDTAGLKVKDDAGVVHDLFYATDRHQGSVALGSGVYDTTVDLTALGLGSAPSNVFVTMQATDGDALLFPMVVVLTAVSLKVVWQSATSNTNYTLHWEIIE